MNVWYSGGGIHPWSGRLSGLLPHLERIKTFPRLVSLPTPTVSFYRHFQLVEILLNCGLASGKTLSNRIWYVRMAQWQLTLRIPSTNFTSLQAFLFFLLLLVCIVLYEHLTQMFVNDICCCCDNGTFRKEIVRDSIQEMLYIFAYIVLICLIGCEDYDVYPYYCRGMI